MSGIKLPNICYHLMKQNLHLFEWKGPQSNPGCLRLGRDWCYQLQPNLFISAGWGKFCKHHSSAETPLYFITALTTCWRKSRAIKNTGITSLKEINLHLSNAISVSALSSSFLFEVDSPVNIIPWRKEIILKTWGSLSSSMNHNSVDALQQVFQIRSRSTL